MEFQALIERWQDKENRESIRAGTIAAATYNVNRDAKTHPDGFTAFDIFDLPKPPPRRLTKAELVARAESFFGAHNRAVARRERKKTGS